MGDELIPIRTPHTNNMNMARDITKMYQGTVDSYIKDSTGKIIGCKVKGNKGESTLIPCKLSAVSPGRWEIPQENDLVIYGYLYGDLINPIILGTVYKMFAGETDGKLVKFTSPGGAVWVMDKDGNVTLTSPKTITLTGTAINLIQTSEELDIVFDTEKGNIILTVRNTGKKITLQFDSGAKIDIEEKKITLNDGTNTVILDKTANKITMSAATIEAAGTSILALLSDLTTFVGSYNAHIHISPMGPTGTPVPTYIVPPTAGTTKLKGA